VPNLIMSIKPQFVSAILDGTKRYELRRRISPSIGANSRILIYCTSPISAVVATASVKQIFHQSVNSIWRNYKHSVGVGSKDFQSYFDEVASGFVIELYEVKRLEIFVPLALLKKKFNINPPQSYQFLSDDLFRELSHAHQDGVVGHEHLSAIRRPRHSPGELLSAFA
jgi:predicted transcriptional regulator